MYIPTPHPFSTWKSNLLWPKCCSAKALKKKKKEEKERKNKEKKKETKKNQKTKPSRCKWSVKKTDVSGWLYSLCKSVPKLKCSRGKGSAPSNTKHP